MNKRISGFVCILFLGGPLAWSAVQPVIAKEKLHSPYAGQQHRAIKSLSKADIAALRAGGGWGFAKAAELNGLPGPIHVLELADELALSADQKARMTRLFEKMRAAAKPLGRQLIAQERRLDRLFATRQITPETLAALVRQIGQTRAALRTVHLAAHLETPKILSAQQVARYIRLRGYGVRRSRENHHHKHHKH